MFSWNEKPVLCLGVLLQILFDRCRKGPSEMKSQSLLPLKKWLRMLVKLKKIRMPKAELDYSFYFLFLLKKNTVL
tara:strand:- start:210 stop:434 length:225 start_codon:yes stop_codon:yes gene_type:complete